MGGPPKKHLLPLLLFVSLFAIFFLSRYHSSVSINPLNPSPNPNFIPINDPNKNLILKNTPSFTFLIKVLAFNRLDSLSRCLQSLANANYDGDTVHLHIYIDHFSSMNDSFNVLDQKLEDSGRMLQFVDRFQWNFGNKVVHYRTGNVGLQAQWLEAWWPGSNDEFAFVVEDDLEVSPLFYHFVKVVIVNYYYNVNNYNPSIYGVSLQRPRFVPGKHGNKIHLDAGTKLFLYQLVGTWGQILFPKPWKEFRLWYDKHKAKGIKPFLDGMVTTGWYKRKGERIWTPWFIKFIHDSGYFNIYTNLGHERALSVSHRDAGVNYGKTAGPDSQLMNESSFDHSILEMQPLSNLKWYDFCFREVVPGRVARGVDDLGPVLLSVLKQQSVLLLSTFGTSETIMRNLLCHFQMLDIRNYIIMGPHSDFLSDLARRGHPVIYANHFLDNMRAKKLIKIQDSQSELADVLVKAYVIKKCLEYGYNSWIMDANMLFVSNDLYREFIMDSPRDFIVGKSSKILFVRSSTSARRIWFGFWNQVAAAVGPTENGNLVFLLEKNGVIINWIDETSFGMKISSTSVNQSTFGATKLVYWPMETGPDLVQRQLEKMGLWSLDNDSSCKAVVCHQSS